VNKGVLGIFVVNHAGGLNEYFEVIICKPDSFRDVIYKLVIFRFVWAVWYWSFGKALRLASL
jgi:hypothetical protein